MFPRSSRRIAGITGTAPPRIETLMANVARVPDDGPEGRAMGTTERTGVADVSTRKESPR